MYMEMDMKMDMKMENRKWKMARMCEWGSGGVCVKCRGTKREGEVNQRA
jgi:hypothetical protein